MIVKELSIIDDRNSKNNLAEYLYIIYYETSYTNTYIRLLRFILILTLTNTKFNITNVL